MRTGEASLAALSGTGSGSGGDRADAAERHEVRADLDAELLEQAPRHGAGRDARRGLARRGALEDVAGIDAIVLEHADEVGVAGPRPGDAPAPRFAGRRPRRP